MTLNNASLPIIFIILFIFAVISFFLSLSETSFIGLSRIRLRHMIAQGVKRAQSIQRLIMKLDKVIAAILIGNNIANIAISAIVTGIFVQLWGYRWGVILSTFVTTFFILVFCEITPKILASKRTEKSALFAAPCMEIMLVVLRPFISFFIGISNFLLKLFGVKAAPKSPIITEEELRTMIEVGSQEGVLSDEEKKMLYHIFEFGDTLVSDVMVPKDKIVAVNLKTNSEELLNIFVEEGHARLPVYKDSPDNIIGVVYARDLLYILRDKGLFVLEDLVQKVYCAPADLRVNELLKKFQADKIQIAVVVNERKSAVGLVTLEDLIEEIVGEIEEVRPGHYAASSSANKI